MYRLRNERHFGFISALFQSEGDQVDITEDRTLAERAFSAIHGSIMNGQFGPGYRLRIEELAATLQISPTPIREALHRLQAIGLAQHRPHRGAHVTDLNPEDLRDLYEARLALEPMAIGRAALAFTPNFAKTASRFLDQLALAEKANDVSEVWKAHTGFHFTFYEAANSAWLIRLITPLWESSQCYRLKWGPLKDDPRRRTREHRSILQACIDHDVDRATSVMHNHLARNANKFATAMGSLPLFELKDLAPAQKTLGRSRQAKRARV
jgi:DNA-binding GntR family transcriptional regulator